MSDDITAISFGTREGDVLRALRLLALVRRLANLRREAEAVQDEIDTLAAGFEG